MGFQFGRWSSTWALPPSALPRTISPSLITMPTPHPVHLRNHYSHVTHQPHWSPLTHSINTISTPVKAELRQAHSSIEDSAPFSYFSQIHIQMYLPRSLHLSPLPWSVRYPQTGKLGHQVVTIIIFSNHLHLQSTHTCTAWKRSDSGRFNTSHLSGTWLLL